MIKFNFNDKLGPFPISIKYQKHNGSQITVNKIHNRLMITVQDDYGLIRKDLTIIHNGNKYSYTDRYPKAVEIIPTENITILSICLGEEEFDIEIEMPKIKEGGNI